MIPRLASALAALALAVCCAGCAAEPAPAPSATGFASEEEAFAAAEETYRAYVDALNRVDLSDPKTFEDVYAWTTGDANAGSRKSFAEMHANEWQVAGSTTITLIAPVNSLGADIVTVAVCADVSNVTLVDDSGASVVASDRRDIQSMEFDLQAAASSPTGLLIARISGREGDPECD